MRMFTIPKGSPVMYIEGDKEWDATNLKGKKTSRKLNFEVEDIILDPVGHVGTTPEMMKTIGGWMAKGGFYGFILEDGKKYYIIVHNSYVRVT